MDEQEIIADCLRGGPDSCRRMVEAFGGLVMATAVNILGNRQDAEDVWQETFLQVFRNLERYDPSRSFKTWLLAIAYRRSMERCGRCRARLASREEARSLLVGARDVGSGDDLWRTIADRAVREPAAPVRATADRVAGLRWAAAAAMAVLVAATGFWLLDRIESVGSGPADESFRIEYVNVDGAPAQTFVYQPLGSDTVFVWAQRAP